MSDFEARVEISDNEDSDEEEEDNDYADDDDFPIEEMTSIPKSNGKVPLGKVSGRILMKHKVTKNSYDPKLHFESICSVRIMRL